MGIPVPLGTGIFKLLQKYPFHITFIHAKINFLLYIYIFYTKDTTEYLIYMFIFLNN